MNKFELLTLDLQKLRNDKQKAILQRFFKTGPGEYAEGDIFLGIKMPQQRIVARKYLHLSLKDLQKLMDSKIHEYRMVALLILVEQYRKSRITSFVSGQVNNKLAENIVIFYLKNTKNINNWDLVDLSAHYILGDYLLNVKFENQNSKFVDNKVLFKLAKSKNLWERRIAIMSTFAFIRAEKYDDTLELAKILLNDKHDLIHKAVGWMLREIGNRDQTTEEIFLKKYYQQMPRTMLRYAIEKFDAKKRSYYLKK